MSRPYRGRACLPTCGPGPTHLPPTNWPAQKPRWERCSTFCIRSRVTSCPNPRPCSEYRRAQLTDHLLKSITLLGGAAGAELPERDTDDSVERQVIGAGPAGIGRMAPARHERDGDLGAPMRYPAAFAVSILAIRVPGPRLGLRGRDQTPDRRRRVAGRLRAGAGQEVITPEGRATVGFADPVAVADDAPALDRLIAFTGRDPAAVLA